MGKTLGTIRGGNAVASGQGTLFASYVPAMGDLLTVMKWRVGRQGHQISPQLPTELFANKVYEFIFPIISGNDAVQSNGKLGQDFQSPGPVLTRLLVR